MGEIAALGTAVCWTFTSLFFTIAGREVGSVIVNRIRLLLAVIFLGITHWLVQGTIFPVAAEPVRWGWLGFSGVIGLVIGDAFLFQAFVMVGPRLSMLLMSLVPVISTLLAWVFLGETLSGLELSAVAVTVVGVAWVVMEQRNGTVHIDRKHYLLGILAGLGGALGQAGGLIAAKNGLIGDFSVLSGTLMRMLVAMAAMWGLTALRGQIVTSVQALSNKRALAAIVGGSIVGPFLGVWLSLIAVDSTRVGIASTLMALTPILILPIAHWVLKETITWRAVSGTVVALAGVTLIFVV